MIGTAEKIAEAKTRWLTFCTHINCSLLAGELSVAYHVTGDRRRAQAQTREAIGEAAAVISAALDIRDADLAWAPVCDAMIRAADIHVSGLEGQLAEFRRSAKVRTQPSRSESKMLAELGIAWTAAMLGARDLYSSLGGDPDELPTFSDFYEVMKAGGTTPLAMPPWPEMEN